MNLQGTEPILDQLAAIIGIFMFLVAVYVFIKLLTQPAPVKQEVEDAIEEEVAIKQEKKAPIPKAQRQPELVLAKSFVAASASSTTVAAPPQAVPSSPNPPQLAFSKVSKSGGNLIRLTLTNIGSDMKFEQVRPDKFNEIDVAFQRKAMLNGDYKCKSSMNFLLKGQDLDYATYHFKVFYRDRKGKRYVQEIAGLGDEVPIVEAPVLTNA